MKLTRACVSEARPLWDDTGTASELSPVTFTGSSLKAPHAAALEACLRWLALSSCIHPSVFQKPRGSGHSGIFILSNICYARDQKLNSLS